MPSSTTPTLAPRATLAAAADVLADNPKLAGAVAEARRRVRSGQWDTRRAVMIALLDYLDLPHADDLWAAVDVLEGEDGEEA